AQGCVIRADDSTERMRLTEQRRLTRLILRRSCAVALRDRLNADAVFDRNEVASHVRVSFPALRGQHALEETIAHRHVSRQRDKLTFVIATALYPWHLTVAREFGLFLASAFARDRFCQCSVNGPS